MFRLFTKNATGVAPDGRWYAGDINAIQDAVAAINDLTQALGVGTLAVGESGLQFMRYGPGEARVSGALRSDGILRGLGGLVAGAFTTTQRGAIVSPPYGLVILNTTTNQYEWNQGTSTTPNWQPIGTAITHKIDVIANRPNANTVAAGSSYYATDQSVFYVSDGTTWQTVNVANSAITAAKIATDTITAANIAPNAVGASELADASVDAAAIQTGAVGSAQIADNSIQPGDLNTLVMRNGRLESGRVGPFSVSPNNSTGGTVFFANAFGGIPAVVVGYDPAGDGVFNPGNRSIFGVATNGFSWSFGTGSSGISNVYFSWIAMGA